MSTTTAFQTEVEPPQEEKVQQLPFPDGSFDFVYSCFVIQHMSKNSAKDFLREVVRVLKPQGKALMEFFGDPNYFHPSGDRYSGIPDKGGMFNNAYLPTTIRRLTYSVAKILWIKPWRVFADGRKFDNWWTLMERGNAKA